MDYVIEQNGKKIVIEVPEKDPELEAKKFKAYADALKSGEGDNNG